MGKGHLCVLLAWACFEAMGQGNVAFQNDAAHLILFTTNSSWVIAADWSPTRQEVPTLQHAGYPSLEMRYSAVGYYGDYLEEGPVFGMTPGQSAESAYPGITDGGSTRNGPVKVVGVPEPFTFALAGLTVAAMLIFRRR